MDLTLKLSNTFEARLAELAWDGADELTKRTMGAVIVSRISASPMLLTEMVNKIVASLKEAIIKSMLTDNKVVKIKNDAYRRNCPHHLQSECS